MGRGCRGQPLFQTLEDRMHFTYLLGTVVEQYEWTIYNWVLMPNHHHLVVELETRNLDDGMKHLHGLFAQRWNPRHDSTGHVFFRRYKSIPLRRPGYPSTVMKYIDLNPVRAGLCDRPEDWEWGGYAALIGRRSSLPFHEADRGVRILSHLDDEPAVNRLAYERHVLNRLARVKGRGTPADSRPSLDEILVPGDAASLREANELWSYSSREIASAVGVTGPTVLNWIRSEKFPQEHQRR
jgi:REP element-mobilizing transposase RayT